MAKKFLVKYMILFFIYPQVRPKRFKNRGKSKVSQLSLSFLTITISSSDKSKLVFKNNQ